MDSVPLERPNGAIDHGGDWAEAEARFGKPRDGWVDLSTGIAPFAYPVDGIAPDVWQRLPDGRAMAALRDAAAACHGVADAACVVAAPGSQAILQWLPRLRGRSGVAVVGPTYAEHAHVWRNAGHEVAEVADMPKTGADVVVVVNPNNPDGRRHAPESLLAAADALAARGGWLVVDEAFADVTPEISVASQVGRPGLIVVRSFGKFYGLAGLRVGFALLPVDLARQLESAVGPWAVSGPAAAVAARALADDSWRTAQRARLSEAAEDLCHLLTEAGLKVVGGTDLFVLAESGDAPATFERLARAGILVRRFADRPRLLRFGLPGIEAHWARLKVALKQPEVP